MVYFLVFDDHTYVCVYYTFMASPIDHTHRMHPRPSRHPLLHTFTHTHHTFTHTHLPPPTPIRSCLYLINAFSLLIDASDALTDIGGLAARLDELLLALTPEEEEEETDGSAETVVAAAPYYTPPVVLSSGGGSKGPVPLLSIEGLSLRLPDGRWLLRDFGLTVRVCDDETLRTQT